MSDTVTTPLPPFWFKLRQGKVEPVENETMMQLTAPNQQEAFILIRQDGDKWAAAVRETADGEDLEATDAQFDNPHRAWEVAFELYRQQLLV